MENNFVLVFILFYISQVDLQTVNQPSCSYGTVLINNVCSECGTSDTTPNIKIIGGQEANPNSWPAQALVIMSYQTYVPNYGIASVGFQCAGTLINSRTLLTAAHCIVKKFTYYGQTIPITPNSYYPTWESMFTVYLGAHDISFLDYWFIDPPSSTLEMSVSKVIIHPSYNDSTISNDIALFILSSPVNTTSAIKYACLPKEQSGSIPTENQACYAVGWGLTQYGGSTSSVLYNVKLTTYNMNFCNFSNPRDPKAQICAGDLAGQKSTCQGDSGGGIYIFDSTINKYVVVGITSYGPLGCAKKSYQGVYTRISNYIDWIKLNYENYIGSSSVTSTATSTTTRSTITTKTSTVTTTRSTITTQTSTVTTTRSTITTQTSTVTTTRSTITTQTSTVTTTRSTTATATIISSITTKLSIPSKNETNIIYDVVNNALNTVNNLINLLESMFNLLRPTNEN